jgi:peptidoglycan-associated lipoprotein
LLYTLASGGRLGRKEVTVSKSTPAVKGPRAIHFKTASRMIRRNHKENTTMQKTPAATVSAGPVTPMIVGPDKDRKDVYILSGLVFFLAIVLAAFWYYSQADEAAHSIHSAEAFNSTDVSSGFKTSTDRSPVAVPPAQTTLRATGSMDILHDDIQFEIGRKGLSDDGKAALQRHADFLKHEPDWGILLQGYTDQQGSMSFNKILGQKRAETVKQHLIALGVPESSIRTVSLGEEGALCIDHSDICRRINRRVHLEMRKVGQEHLLVPTVAVELATELEGTGPMSETFQLSPADLEGTILEPTAGD